MTSVALTPELRERFHDGVRRMINDIDIEAGKTAQEALDPTKDQKILAVRVYHYQGRIQGLQDALKILDWVARDIKLAGEAK